MILILLTTLAVLYGVYYYQKLSFFRSQGIRGRWPLPVVGDVFQALSQPLCEYDQKCFKKYGRVYYDHATLGLRMLVTSDPDMVHRVLREHCFTERLPLPYLPLFIRRGIIFLEYSDWKRVRTIISPIFTSGKLKRIFCSLRYPLKYSLDNFDELIQKGQGQNINVKEMAKFFSVDAIGRVVFAFDVNSFKNQENEFFINVGRLLKISPLVFVTGCILPEFLFKALRLSFFNSKSINYFSQRALEMIDLRRKQPEVKYDDFLQLLMEAEAENQDNPEWRQLDREEIVGQCLMFFFAGMETISSAISNCFYELALNPEIQETLYKELKRAYPEPEVDYEQIKSCEYLDFFFKEVMRKNVTITRLGRVASRDYEFPNGIKVRRGQFIGLSTHNLHHDPQLYEEPFRFDPLRFENEKEFPPGSYIPFSDGPKNCVGMRFALIEVKMFLIYFCRKYRVVQNKHTEVPPKYVKLIALNTYDNLHVAVERR